jgi:hypothetical protein
MSEIYHEGNRVECVVESIQRTTGAVWHGDRGTVVKVHSPFIGPDTLKVRWDNEAVMDDVPTLEVTRV